MNKLNLSKIPKLLNLYWDGSKMSYLQYLTVISFHKHNPDWDIHVYVSKTTCNAKTWLTKEQKLEYVGEDFFLKLKSLNFVKIKYFDFSNNFPNEQIPGVFKSDLLRWYLLGTVGGVWSDFDILYIKSLDLPQFETFDGSFCKDSLDMAITFDGFHHIIGFYLSKPNNNFFSNIYNNATQKLNLYEYQSIGSRLLMSMYPTLDSIQTLHPDINFVNLPMSVVYPFNDGNIDQIFNSTNDSFISPNTIGIHWYNGSNISKLFNNSFEESLKKDSVIARLIKQNYC